MFLSGRGMDAIVAAMDQESLEQTLEGLSPVVRFLPETDSTNRVALEWAQSGAPGGALVVTDFQTAGRGRFDRRWFGPPGECLMLSVVLRPACEQEEAPLVNLAAAVALVDAVADEGLQARVKWPNDVRIKGRKTAGILAETVPTKVKDRSPAREGGLCLVLGMGVNVNVMQFPPELADSATSLALEAGRVIDRIGLLRRFLKHLGGLLGSFPAGVVEAYVPRSDVLGRNVRVHLPKGVVEGKAERIDALGNLVLDTGEVVSVGDVGYLESGDL